MPSGADQDSSSDAAAKDKGEQESSSPAESLGTEGAPDHEGDVPTSMDAQPSLDTTPTAQPPPHEIQVDRCEMEGIEVIASGTITNLDTESHIFAVQVEFFDAGGAKIEEGVDFLPPLDPGQTARWQQDNFTRSEFTLGDCVASLL